MVIGYPFNAGQLGYDCRYSKTPGMPVTGGDNFRGLKPLWHLVSRLKWMPNIPMLTLPTVARAPRAGDQGAA